MTQDERLLKYLLIIKAACYQMQYPVWELLMSPPTYAHPPPVCPSARLIGRRARLRYVKARICSSCAGMT